VTITYTSDDGVLAATVTCQFARILPGTPTILSVSATFEEPT
jgi:hypothetical protein